MRSGTHTRARKGRSTCSCGTTLEVVVGDSGRGMAPSPDTAGPGLGLALIAALTDSFEIERGLGTGCRLVMSFLRGRTEPAVGLA